MTRPHWSADGVAPRAKMNQQRARRWQAAKERQAQLQNSPVKDFFDDSTVQSKQEQVEAVGGDLGFDSNQITPGTPLMMEVSKLLHKYVAEKIATDKAWQQILVIVSDHLVPGEGGCNC